jgi:hypothetical protein
LHLAELAAKGVLINGFTNINKNDVSKVQYLDDPKCEPFWKKLSEVDVPAKGGTKARRRYGSVLAVML